MLILDTDILSLVQTGQSPEAQRLKDRIRASREIPFVTVVTLHEQMRGRIAQCAAANDPDRYVVAARQLRDTFEDYRTRNLIDFGERAAANFKELKAAKVRIGTMDLRIASIALANGATLVTRNLSDYRKVPGLRAEDWTVAAEGEA